MVFNKRGQVSAETAVLFTFVVAGFVFMGVYLQRAAQGGVKSNADGLGSQYSSQSAYNSASVQVSKSDAVSSSSGSCSESSHGVGTGAAKAVTTCVAPPAP